MTTIIGLSGSLRTGSFNTMLLNAAEQCMPAGAMLQIETIRGIPLYDGDIEKNEGIPAIVAQLKDSIATADGLLLATPEYNHSVPGVFKNAIDWLSRPLADVPRVFGDKPVAVIGTSGGQFGSARAQLAWSVVLHKLNTRLFNPDAPIQVGFAGKVFDADGRLTDDTWRARLVTYLADFVAYCAA